LISAVFLLAIIDGEQNKFEANAAIHVVNGSYIGIGFYFFLMKNYPESFSDLWQSILPSAPQAFDMLLLCFFFQNVGSYILWAWITPLSQAVSKWSTLPNNAVNLTFIKTPQHQVILFIILSSFGLISRLWNLSLGNIYYTQGSGVPFFISSFLFQFDRLYVIGWLYGYSLWLKPYFRRNTVVRLTWLLIFVEFIYQLFSGSKGRFFNFVILPMASVFILTKQKVGWRAIGLIGGGGLLSWLLVYPILVIYRHLLVTTALGGNINPIDTLNLAFETLSTYSLDTYIETILRPLNDSGIAEQVTAMTSIIHYQVSQEGSLLWQRLFLFWVPRFLWSDKPIALSGNLIGRLSNRLNDHDFMTSVLITGVGELYLYYGLLGSTLMALVGLLFRWMNESISPFRYPTPFRVAVFVAFLPLMQGILSGTFESGLTGIILQLGVLYFVLNFVKMVIL
ncbi:MAG: hypothetical protein F6K65_37990, partial [Moorea sp. SIO3C2]|nr:hypothetical protein [Moorena sp. SIO3C2]